MSTTHIHVSRTPSPATYSHVSAPTQCVGAGGFRYAYRRFGIEIGTPLVFLPHFRAGMDHWDPLVTDGLGANRPVILFDNAGVASSSGETPDTFEAQAEHVATFVRALGLQRVDVLGFSIGGYVAQAFTLRFPDLVRRLVLVGTAPRGGEQEGTHPDVLRVARNLVPSREDFLFLFFEPSETSQAAGKAFWERRHQRTTDVDPPSSEQTMKAQTVAIQSWREQQPTPYAELQQIKQPTLVVNGRHDIMVPTINSYILSQHIPNAELILYPDSGHGSLFQYPRLFVSHVARFLDADVACS
jgi:pimeloyl-ACP methyl ester carboxylesterase